MINIIATLHVSENAKKAVKEKMKVLVKESRAEPGCIMYDFYEINKSSMPGVENTGGDYTVIERWQEMAALKAHAESMHFTKFMESFSEEELKLTVQILEEV